MNNNEFRTPLLQSGAILLAIVIIISMVPSGDGVGVGTMIAGFFSGVIKLLIFLIGITLAVGVAIAALIGVFIAAIALHSPEKAGEVWAATKQRFAGLIQESVTCSCDESKECAVEEVATVDIGITQEEYDQMKSTISSLQSANSQLQADVTSLSGTNAKLQEDITSLTTMVDELKESETKINELIAELSSKAEEDKTTELKEKLKQLEEMATKTNQSISDIAVRLEALEEITTSPDGDNQPSGIFSYIENESDRDLLTTKVQEGVAKELTYAQFDEFLTEELSAELDQIVKDHPSLTKDYIRSMRK